MLVDPHDAAYALAPLESLVTLALEAFDTGGVWGRRGRRQGLFGRLRGHLAEGAPPQGKQPRRPSKAAP